MQKLIVLIFVSTMTLFAQTITIAVAANVSYAIDALKEEFAKIHPEVDVVVILGSSGKLTAQIANGAPYGLFMSANMKYPQVLYNKKIAITKPVVYTKGALALLSVKQRNFSQGIKLLKSNSIKRIAIASPKIAPYGKAALEAIKNANIYKDIKQKFIYGESVSQTLSYTMHAADIGLVAKSALFSSKMTRYKKNRNFHDVELSLYTPIEQGIVLLKRAEKNKAYKFFYDFILSQKAKKIFAKYGYITS